MQLTSDMQTGNTWFDLTIGRGPIRGPLRQTIGLLLKVRVDPSIEAFFDGQSGGQQHDVNMYNAYWQSLDPSKTLAIYNMQKAIVPERTYTLYQPGAPLQVSSRLVQEGLLYNLSFLRIVGISNPEGVSFGLAGAYSESFVRSLSKDLVAQVKMFIKDFIVPVNINVRIVSRDL